MKKIFLFCTVFLSGFVMSISPSKAIAPEEAAALQGQTATVTGLVVSARKSAGGAMYLNFGAAYPNQVFSVFIHKQDAPNFPEAATYQGKTVSVTGTISMTKDGKPEIQVKTVDQLVVSDAASAAASPAPSPSATPAAK